MITLGVAAVFVITSVIAVLYFTSENREKAIPEESDAPVPSASSQPTPAEESGSGEPVSSIDEPSVPEGEDENALVDGGEVAPMLSPDFTQMKEGVTFVKMNEPLTMHSKYYKQGEVREEQALNLGWNGDLLFTVKRAQLLEYDKEDKNDWGEQMNEFAKCVNYESPAVLLLDIEIENKDAAQNFGVQYDFHTSYKIQSKSFYSVEAAQMPGAADYIGEYYYAEGYFSEHGEDKDYYSFSLPEGESIAFNYAFYIDKKLLDHELYFNPVNGSARTSFLGIELDKIEGR